MMKSSATQTFLALQEGHKTLDEYKFSNVDHLKEFRNQTQYLAYCLMSLWTSKPTHETHNYLALIKDNKLYFKGFLKKNR